MDTEEFEAALDDAVSVEDAAPLCNTLASEPEIAVDSVQPDPIIPTEPQPVLETDHNYHRPPTEPPPETSSHSIHPNAATNDEDATDNNILDTIKEVLNLLRACLHENWIPVAAQEGFHILLLSRGEDKAIQRNVFCYFNGAVRITVHRRSLPADLHAEILKNSSPSVTLSAASVKEFVDRVVISECCEVF